MLKKIGYSFKILDYESWRQNLLQKAGDDDENILKGLIPLFSTINFSEMSHYVNFRCDNVIDALNKSLIKCPKFDEKLLKKYLKYYIKIGFLPPYA